MVKVIVEGFIIIPNSDLPIVKNELLNHKKLTLREIGCLTFSVTPDENNPCKYNVYEEFVNRDAFDSHQARVKLSKWEFNGDSRSNFLLFTKMVKSSA